MDRERIAEFVGVKIALKLSSAEALGVELLATLDRVRDDGVVISEDDEKEEEEEMESCKGPWTYRFSI